MKFFFPFGEKGREKIVEKLTSGSVLDEACGTGTLLELAGKKGLECLGISTSCTGNCPPNYPSSAIYTNIESGIKCWGRSL